MFAIINNNLPLISVLSISSVLISGVSINIYLLHKKMKYYRAYMNKL